MANPWSIKTWTACKLSQNKSTICGGLLIVASLCLMFLCVVHLQGNRMVTPPPYQPPVFIQKPLNSTRKTILNWNSYWGVRHFFGSIGNDIFVHMKCPVSDCELWDKCDDKPDFPYEQYDAIIFFGFDTAQGPIYSDQPLERLPHQRYIFYIDEPPIYHEPDYTHLEHFYNWTMTYRGDSDIYAPYGWFVNTTMLPVSSSRFKLPYLWTPPIFKNMSVPVTVGTKTKLVAWLVSNMNSKSGRKHYVKQLSKYIPIDIYGKGKLQCDDCHQLFKTTYKFYLSFENSFCKDYITEKFYGTILNDVVPIVLGGGNYSRYAPPLSYIDVKDFRSPRELANYLLYLDKNKEEYEKYFWWQSYYKVGDFSMVGGLCELCEKLHNPNLPPKVYPDISGWWGGPGICHGPKDYFAHEKDHNVTSSEHSTSTLCK